jgi:hypothetical protein
MTVNGRRRFLRHEDLISWYLLQVKKKKKILVRCKRSHIFFSTLLKCSMPDDRQVSLLSPSLPSNLLMSWIPALPLHRFLVLKKRLGPFPFPANNSMMTMGDKICQGIFENEQAVWYSSSVFDCEGNWRYHSYLIWKFGRSISLLEAKCINQPADIAISNQF